MPLILLAALISIGCALLTLARWSERQRIRQSGTQLMAQIVQIRSWQEPPDSNGFFAAAGRGSLLWGGGPRWYYEIIAECKDVATGETYTLSSGPRKGLAHHRRGDYLPAYISSKGNLLEIS
ncbi:hypothetical protein KDH_70370 [Dictyobacter sp. S3.2.2.5]|uniref:Uncharacterized protein n=2 Tax=Dictyobacter halimunensis TaxID=3026934 RepID=A0ABQ6G131_9CHLR|nr:hypothetical protein KDH_70370 [Dictyobacter sp. S3.2.2.5]